MTTRPKISDTQLAEWQASGHKYKIIAAAIAEWASKQDRGGTAR